MADIKPLTKIADKWGSNASSSESRSSYTEGVTSPRRSWSASAVAADQARKDGLAAADARNAFVNGVNAAGDSKWKNRAQTVGPSRFSQGVQAGKPSYQQGFAPYHGIISGVTLPPRGPKGSPENIDRVRAIAEALHTAKVSS